MASVIPKFIMVGMSGGVDSSIAAFLLKEAGHHVEGLFMKNWEEADASTPCPAAIDQADAEAVCDLLRIPLHTMNFSDDYWQNVFTHFLEEYRAGRTPNPDILCNKEIKFKAFLNYAKQRGAEAIATGHYARIVEHKSHHLLKAKDLSKDQSYFLYALDQEQLAHTLFPLATMTKANVRTLAKTLGFKNHDKKDSTGICFIGERKFKSFLQEFLPTTPGVIETIEGEILGEHDGLMYYTLGQRQGLSIGGCKNKAELPWYVAHKDLKKNKLIVVQGQDHPALFKSTLLVNDPHWINPLESLPRNLTAKIRYRQADQKCHIEPLIGNRYRVIFDQPQRTVTPGQSIVFYQDDICLGGGIIEFDAH